MIDLLFESSLVSNKDVIDRLNITPVTATNLMNKFEEVGILNEITGKKRNKRHLFTKYVNIISRGTGNL